MADLSLTFDPILTQELRQKFDLSLEPIDFEAGDKCDILSSTRALSSVHNTLYTQTT